MKGDRIRVTNGTIYEDREGVLVFVYEVTLDKEGRPILAHDGTVSISSQGGVKNGSTGVINGYPEKVHRTQLMDAEQSIGLGGNDFIQMVPVFLDTYQKLGWFPTENIRVVSGGVSQ